VSSIVYIVRAVRKLSQDSMISILSILGFGSNDSNYRGEVGGVDAVERVLSQRRHGRETPAVEFGEPTLVDRAVGPETDFFVVFPTSTADGVADSPDLEYELPEDPDGPDSELNHALNALGFGDLNEVEGTRVEGKWQDGVVVPRAIAEADI